MHKVLFIIAILLSSLLYSQSQQVDTIQNSDTLRKNIIKFRIISTIELINNVNRQIIGLEYEHKLNNITSLVLDFDIGYFDKYVYYKYYNFFTLVDELPYIKKTVTTKGFHIAPNYKYYFYNFNHISLSGFSIGSAIDYYFYKKNYDYFDSRTNITTKTNYNSQQFSLGAVLGLQFLIKNRITIDVSSSLFLKLFSFTSNNGDEIYSKNSFWVSDNGNLWAVYRVKLGYAFGK